MVKIVLFGDDVSETAVHVPNGKRKGINLIRMVENLLPWVGESEWSKYVSLVSKNGGRYPERIVNGSSAPVESLVRILDALSSISKSGGEAYGKTGCAVCVIDNASILSARTCEELLYKKLDSLAKKRVTNCFRKLSYKFQKMGKCCVYPLAQHLKSEYNALEMELFNRIDISLSMEEWDEICMSDRVDADKLSALTDLKGRCLQAFYFLYCCDGSIDVANAGKIICMSDLSPPTTYFDNEIEAIEKSIMHYPPASLCTRVEFDWEISRLVPT